jgi:hypothetical protein
MRGFSLILTYNLLPTFPGYILVLPRYALASQQNGTTDEQSLLGILKVKLQHLAPRLNDEDDLEAKRGCLQISKALTAQLERPENIAVDLAFSVSVDLL